VAEPVRAAAADDATCPRCGAGFHCGAHEKSCECATVQLDEATRRAIGRDFAGCLCVACLRELQAAPDSPRQYLTRA